MIEKTVLDYLNTQLAQVCPVYMETPERPPATYVLLEKMGSSVENHINRATIAVQSIAPSLYEAASLNETVCEAMDMLITENVGRSDRNSDYYFPDTDRGLYRYQAIYDIVY